MAEQNLGRVVGSKIYSGTVDNHTNIQSYLTSLGIIPLIYDLYFSSSYNVYQYQLVENVPTWTLLMNIKGAAGTFAVAKTYSSVAAMEAGYATDGLAKGSLVLIETGNVDDADNAKLYVKGDTQYNYLTDLSGAQGIQGPKGDKGDTGSTGPVGATFVPTVDGNGNISWTNDKGLTNPTTQNIKGPKGDTGDAGATGNTGDTGATFTPSVDASGNISWTNDKGLSNPATQNIKGPKGDTGATGPKGDTGATGADGKTPTLTINASGELVATYE